MRLLLVTHERGMRGGETQLALVAGALAALGHEVTVAAPADAAVLARLPAAVARRTFFAVNDLDLLAAARLARTIRAARPEVVHAFTGRAHAIARMALLAGGPPLVVSRLAGFPPKRTLASRVKFAGVAAYAAVSGQAKEALVAAGVAQSRIAIVPSAVADEFLAGRGGGGSGNVVGCVAALSPEKGHETLVAACALVAARQPVELRLVGDGPERARIQARARALGFTGLRLLGALSGAAAVAEALAGFTVFALASRVEGLPTSVLEAMAAGVPVVATAVGGVPEIVQDKVTGRLVPPGDAALLARAIAELLGNGGERARLAAAARRVAAAHAVGKVAASYEALYREVAGAV